MMLKRYVCPECSGPHALAEHGNVEAQRARLREAVVDAAKAYGRAARATVDHMKTVDATEECSREGWQLLRDLEATWDDLTLKAIAALLEFEATQEKK